MVENNFIEKRKYFRWPAEVEIKFKLKGDGVQHPDIGNFGALSKNLSVEGICFVSENKLVPGNVLRLELSLPRQKDLVYLEGEVRWSVPMQKIDQKGMFETGIKLFTVRKQDSSRFIQYICDHITKKN